MAEKYKDAAVIDNSKYVETSRIHKSNNAKRGAFAAGLFAMLVGGYLLFKQFASNEIFMPAKHETTITADRNLVDTVYAAKGNTVWGIIKDNYDLTDNRLIGQKVNEIAEYNYKNNNEQRKSRIDNRAVVDGKVVNSADGIKFDYLLIGSRILLPKIQKDIISINYFKDSSGKLYDENKQPITYNDLKEIVRKKLNMQNVNDTYVIDKSDSLITDILTDLESNTTRLRGISGKVVDDNSFKDTSVISKNNVLKPKYYNLATIVDNINATFQTDRTYNDYYRHSDWNDSMNGNYSYEKLQSSEYKNNLLGFLVDTYKNNTVKEATNILGMSKYRLYKTLDIEFGKGMMRKRNLAMIY